MICTKLSNKDHLSHRSVSLRTVTTCSTSVFLMKNETHEFLTADSMCCGICGFAKVEVEETGEGEPRERLTNAHDEPGCYRPWWFPPCCIHTCCLLEQRAVPHPPSGRPGQKRSPSPLATAPQPERSPSAHSPSLPTSSTCLKNTKTHASYVIGILVQQC